MSSLPFHILLSGLFLLPHILSAQDMRVHFNPVFNRQPILAGQASFDLKGDSLAIHTLKFYLSNFVFLSNGNEIWQEKNSYHLLDIEEENSLSISFSPGEKLDFDAVQFCLGIDSLTNVSGAFGGDLDPTKGMYWAWNSGYVNFKIEGYFEKCPARNHEFQFHIGGYMPPFQSLQTIILPVVSKNEIQVNMDLAAFFENIDWDKSNHIMSPSAASANMAKLLSGIFHINEH